MDSFIDYICCVKNTSWKTKPFCKEDACILGMMAYLNYDGLVEDTRGGLVSLDELANSRDFLKMFPKYNMKEYRLLFDTLWASERFGNMKLGCYVNRIEADNDTQFAAITFVVSGEFVYVAFRGTDDNIIGWEEDFKLALNKPIMGQMLSVKYINDVASRFRGSFYIGGHSKGGNLAVYSAMNCVEHIRERITKIYAMDSPGFRKEILLESGFDRIRDKVVCIIPDQSIIGMLFAYDCEIFVVASHVSGVHQHTMFTWIIKGDCMKEARISDAHKNFLNMLNGWLYSQNECEMEQFVALSCNILNSLGASTVSELRKDKIKTMVEFIKTTSGLDAESKKRLAKMMRAYIKSYSQKFFPQRTNSVPRLEAKD